MVKFKNYIFLFFLGLLFSLNANAQIDKTFWFAAPEVTSLHTDRPIKFVLSAFDRSATVTISQPANAVNFSPIVVNIPANGIQIIREY
jgi:hypothetical protein